VSSTADRGSSLVRRIQALSPEKRAIFERLAATPGDAGHGPTPIDRRRLMSPAPLSFAQQRLWLLDQLMPDTSLFNLSGAIRIAEAFDERILERSVNELVRRHECLRTTFATVNGEPVQEILPELFVELRTVDLRSLPGAARDAEAESLLAEEGEAPFDLESGPLLRTLLVRTGDADCVFHVVMHHIVSDAWSLDIFWSELSTIWEALEAGEPSPLPDLPIQYADFAVWERDRLAGPALAELVAYWKRRLAGLPVIELPTDWPRPAVPSGRGAVRYVTVPAGVVSRLRALGRDESATLFMIMLAAFETLLARYTGEDDVVVGTFTANRDHAEIEGLIGFFVNALVLREDLSGRPTFRELLRQVRATAVEAYTHEEMPFARLIHELSPERDLSRNPLFQVAFQMLNTPGIREEDEPDAAGGILDLPRTTAVLDLMCTIREVGDRVEAELEYSTDLFAEETIVALGEHFATLLAAAADDPDGRVHELPLVADDVRRRVVDRWNRTATRYADADSLVSLLEAQVARTPDAIAVRCNGATATYAALNGRANGLARELRDLGIADEATVAVCVERSIDLVVALLAVFKAGGVYVPLDPRLPRDRVARIVDDAGPAAIVAQRPLLSRLPTTNRPVLDIAGFDHEREPNLGVPISPDALAYVIYTSGSTGRPKGVAVEHRQILNRLHWMWDAYPFDAGEVSCQKTAIGFVDSLWELLGPLLKGVPSVVVPDELVADARLLVDELSGEAVTRIWLVPSFLRALLEAFPNLGERVPELRFWVASGEPLTVDLAELFAERVPHGTLFNLYGTSEVWDATWYEPRGGGARLGRVPIGRPIANVTAYVLDSQGSPTPPGVPGELHVGGVGLARGYVNDPGLTAERFVPDPFGAAPGARLYRTGDLARFQSDGNIEFLGRKDDQVKLRGFRIELGEIEAALGRHPTVRHSAVVLRDDEPVEPRLVGYVVRATDDATPEDAYAASLRRFLRRTLPEYMIPASFVTLFALPLTPTGKVDRRALPAPNAALALRSRRYAAPRTPAESELAGIWSQLLGVGQVGVHDSFFELGGHSLLGIRALARMKEAFGVEIPFRAIFETPTIAGLAARIGAAQARGDAEETSPIVRLSRADRAAIVVLDEDDDPELAFSAEGQE
jgi:amino acid adenylation domain-containing protein